MITQCYVCKKYLVGGEWISEDDSLTVSQIMIVRKNINAISHGLCSVCTKSEFEIVNRELEELKAGLEFIAGKVNKDEPM